MPYLDSNMYLSYFEKYKLLIIIRVVPDTDLAGYLTAGYPAINFAEYPAQFSLFFRFKQFSYHC